MNQPTATDPGAATDDLWAALEQVLSDHFGRPCAVVRLERRPSDYRSSFALEELDVGLGDGTKLQMIFKDLGLAALSEAARAAKPSFLIDPRREIDVYRTILAPAPLGTATYYGSVLDPAAGRCWLFLERVPGVELYQVGEFAIWQRVACWLAGLHARFSTEVVRLGRGGYLLRHDAEFYQRWARRAQAFHPVLEGLVRRYDVVVERLLALPATLLHGEFYASNILVQETAAGLRVCPVDWEMAALGPGLMDLAALCAGEWTEEQRQALAWAYRAALPAESCLRLSSEVFLRSLDCCRLHAAVQWLGWSADWSPPSTHAQDWLAQALELAGQLGLSRGG